MVPELIPGHGDTVYHIPLEAFDDRIEIVAELRPQPGEMRQPANSYGDILQSVRVNCDRKRAIPLVDFRNSPRYERLTATSTANVQVITHTVDPVTELALIHPAAKVVHLIS